MAAQGRQTATTCRGLAQRAKPRNMHTTAGSDKDSGYSDVASECLSSVEQTDAEDGPPTLRWITGERRPECPQPGPLLVLKNLLVDQDSGPDPHIPSWTVRPSFQLFPSSSQVLVFPPSLSPTKSQSTKYLPILNSYTKIAPHPSPLHGNKRRADALCHNRAKRLLSETHSSIGQEKVPSVGHEEGQVLSQVAACSDSSANTPQGGTGQSKSLGTDVGDPRTASLPDIFQKAESSVPEEHQKRTRRFQNTLDVLHRSGLFSIAMKTKELARLNQVTQVQLERLQEQVSLYCMAISSNNPQDWQMVQDSLAECNVPLKEIDV
ncbi:CLOCK-interacting pacemaker [Mixophyes fleayi]|uniref:CLOCK-interacting pacemaker n=1 Tax=Mixophyes fleayi TaxID=3061075 RepID=UPI003F4E2E06